MTLEQLLQWWNLIYLVPLFLALLYITLYTLTGISFGEPDVDADMDADVDAEVDADADTDVDADVDADADTDVDADVDADAEAEAEGEGHLHADGGVSALGAMASFLGVGRVPVSIVLMVLLLVWGVVGLIANRLMVARMAAPAMVAIYSLPLALLVSILACRFTSALIARYLPLNQNSARRRHELLGIVGEALYDIDETFGMVSGRDERGDLFQVGCRIHGDQKPIAKGSRVQLVAYNAREGVFFVIPEEGL